MTGPALGRAAGNPHRSILKSLVPSSSRRITGAGSVGQMSSRGSRFGAAVGKRIGALIWLNARRYSSYGTRFPKSLHTESHPLVEHHAFRRRRLVSAPLTFFA